MPTVTIKSHPRRPHVSGAETASEWETEDNPGSQTPRVAPQMARMGSNRMAVTSSINRDLAAAQNSSHTSQKFDTPRRPGGLAGATPSNFGATPRRNRWDVGQANPGAGGQTPSVIGGGFGATPSRFSSLKQVDNATPSRFSVATPLRGQVMGAATPKIVSRFGDMPPAG